MRPEQHYELLRSLGLVADEEQSVERDEPGDKPVGEWTDAEHAAARLDHERRMREKAQQDERDRLEAERQHNRTDEQRFGDAVSASLQPPVKQAADRELIESLHGTDEPSDTGFGVTPNPRDERPPGWELRNYEPGNERSPDS
jgi:hypothetical protein